MAFPTTGILDSFTGADETPIATNWSGPIFSGIGQLRRLSNKLAPSASAFGGSWYDISTYGPNCEVYATIDTLATSNTYTGILYARAQNVNTTSLDGYVLAFFDSGVGGSGTFRLYREDDGTDTQIGSDYVPPAGVQLGDKYGFRCTGSLIEAFYCPVSTGIWTASAVISATDATYGAAGFLGVALDNAGAAFRLDEFGGGTIVVPPVGYPVAWLTA